MRACVALDDLRKVGATSLHDEVAEVPQIFKSISQCSKQF
jgi:hypothetical protein